MSKRNKDRNLLGKSPALSNKKINDGQKREQLRIFISYSHKDNEKVDQIYGTLSKLNFNIWVDRHSLRDGDNIQETTSHAINDADIFIIVISEHALQSDWIQAETSAAIVNKQISKKTKRIIPIKLDQASVPSLISQYLYIDFSYDFSAGLAILTHAIEEISKDGELIKGEAVAVGQTRETHEQNLRDALRKGRLTLVCGAGVSVAAGIPPWNGLLARLLKKMLEALSATHSIALDPETIDKIQNDLGRSSSLIIGKYLKNNLRKEFEREVRNSLYESTISESNLIRSIVNLARPHRDSKSLESIITFNFDDMIEEALNSTSIPNKTIFSESINHAPHQIPIYHVHGFLPKDGKIPDINIVFSEDAYHSQFIDPFSWSNLIQLNKLSQTTCLFIVISLTDPNMRRLLDVAWRKNPGKTKTHYIIKKPPGSNKDLSTQKITSILEEQDANLLGLNVLWIEEFDDLPLLLDRITVL